MFRLLFFRHIPLSATLYKILVMDFHTWWRYHYFCFTGTAQQSTLSTYFVFGELSDDCWAVPVKQLGWQWPLVSSSTTKICKSKILRKKCSLVLLFKISPFLLPFLPSVSSITSGYFRKSRHGNARHEMRLSRWKLH